MSKKISIPDAKQRLLTCCMMSTNTYINDFSIDGRVSDVVIAMKLHALETVKIYHERVLEKVGDSPNLRELFTQIEKELK